MVDAAGGDAPGGINLFDVIPADAPPYVIVTFLACVTIVYLARIAATRWPQQTPTVPPPHAGAGDDGGRVATIARLAQELADAEQRVAKAEAAARAADRRSDALEARLTEARAALGRAAAELAALRASMVPLHHEPGRRVDHTPPARGYWRRHATPPPTAPGDNPPADDAHTDPLGPRPPTGARHA